MAGQELRGKSALRRAVTGRIERGEATPIVEVPVDPSQQPYFRELPDRPWDLSVKPQTMAGHGLTGRWEWAIISRTEHRPRIRYGDAPTKDRALLDMGYALGQLLP